MYDKFCENCKNKKLHTELKQRCKKWWENAIEEEKELLNSSSETPPPPTDNNDEIGALELKPSLKPKSDRDR